MSVRCWPFRPFAAMNALLDQAREDGRQEGLFAVEREADKKQREAYFYAEEHANVIRSAVSAARRRGDSR